jgi:parallel beta-helix repeat protein
MKTVKAKKRLNPEIRYKIFSLVMLSVLFFSVLVLLNDSWEGKSINDDLNSINDDRERREIGQKPDFEFEIGVPVSSWFNNSADPIFIDATATGVDAHNWTWARTQEWCRVGNGSVGNPYLLENVSIDCGGLGTGIFINNSHNIHFKIQNCTVTNSGSGDYDGGIKLENTSNGTIMDNNCSENGRSGVIFFNKCDFNTIANNTANNNLVYGIYLNTDCDSNTILNNTANNNLVNGIYLNTDCTFNTLSNNTANDNMDYGIFLRSNCDSNTLSNNFACNDGTTNQNHGIYLGSGCDFNTLSNNTANDNTFYGIYLNTDCGNNTLSNNFACNDGTFNQNHGIYLNTDCGNNTISNNTANDNRDYGIYLYSGCDFNTLSNNFACNDGTTNQNIGIYLDSGCDSNTLSNNTANDNMDYGIYLRDNCNSNTLSNNFACNDGTTNQNYGIYLYTNCDNNTISNNTANDNMDYGIFLRSNCDSNTLSNNFACNDGTTNQYHGIYLDSGCDFNTIANNTANDNNGVGIFLYSGCDSNTLSNNFACNDGTTNQNHGIYLNTDCGNNTLSNNTANNNNDYGIYLSTDCDSNTLSINTANNNLVNGIYLRDNCDSNTISNNTANDNMDYGIYLSTDCDSNTLSNNFACNDGTTNQNYGVYLYSGCDSNTILNNTANNNLVNGIYLYTDCDANTIANNTANDNMDHGIYLNTDCDANTILNNTANNNLVNGIYLNTDCTFNTLSHNTANDNTDYGIYLDSGCDSNIVHNNDLYANNYGIGIDISSSDNRLFLNRLSNINDNAVDNNGSNYWDNGSIGNFWSNYVGEDNDLNGIGDTPHEVRSGSGIYDMFPIIYLGNFFNPQPTEKTIEIGTLGTELVWSLTDFVLDSISYEIFKDGVLFTVGSINQGTSEIKISIDGLEVGDFQYQLSIVWPFHINDFVKVIVSNSIPTMVIPVESIIYEVGSTNNTITWSFSDPSVENPSYTIYQNEIAIVSDVSCNPEEIIEISIDGLAVGEYTFKIEVHDGYGKIVRKIVCIIVNNTEPILITPLVDLSYDVGSTNNTIIWSFSDISVNNPTYTVYRNGLPIIKGVACNAGEQIIIPVNGLEAGEYIYVIELDDGYGSICAKTVIVTVNAQEESPDYSPYLIASIIGAFTAISIVASAIIHGRMVRGKSTVTHPSDSNVHPSDSNVHPSDSNVHPSDLKADPIDKDINPDPSSKSELNRLEDSKNRKHPIKKTPTNKTSRRKK